ncbi:tetratricopeptide repeat protein [Salisediminibacterium halotolerans]|uniref:Tetratricopeptide repeat-containing protein n=1 Tax=Salisediminibacterium halotolerans TaxID=517425 RepID=A0A1H9U3K6_9BACI|nr:tetratricopeptide repeat protein [Salisediminibacterium haloalkalitolerans]SES03737.1 Tetratricopeptide repeat-containing protein [Salisediminibacterium haloalkalitolerans]
MSSKSHDPSENDNVILFPGLVQKLSEKGMTALKEQKYYDALTYFNQSTELDPEHAQARYGLVITNIELNRLDEAKKYCESMLKEGIGDYYEVLQVYVSLLVQLGAYDEVVDLLEVVIQEDKLPSEMAETFYQLLDFSRQMTDEYGAPSDDTLMEEQALMPPPAELINDLEKGNPDQQWGAIQQLSHHKLADVEDAYRDFLKSKDQHPVLKSYILQLLKEMDSTGTFVVHKFGESFTIELHKEDLFHETFGMQVIDRLEKELADDNPTLFDIVQQVWWHYLFALYPKKPEPADIDIWACALHETGRHLLSDGEEFISLSAHYGTDESDVMMCTEHIKEIEQLLFSMNEMSAYREGEQ